MATMASMETKGRREREKTNTGAPRIYRMGSEGIGSTVKTNSILGDFTRGKIPKQDQPIGKVTTLTQYFPTFTGNLCSPATRQIKD